MGELIPEHDWQRLLLDWERDKAPDNDYNDGEPLDPYRFGHSTPGDELTPLSWQERIDRRTFRTPFERWEQILVWGIVAICGLALAMLFHLGRSLK